MTEVGPVLTSPTQFEVILIEEDEKEGPSSESGQFCSTFPSSSSAIQVDAIELSPRHGAPMPRPARRSLNRPCGSPSMFHQNAEHSHPPPRELTRFNATLPSRQPDQSGAQYRASESPSHSPALHHGILIGSGHPLLDNDHTFWDMDHSSIGVQLLSAPSHLNRFPNGQLQHTMPPPSILEWQSTNTHTQSSVYPFEFDRLSQPGSLSLPFQVDDRSGLVPTTSPPSPHCCTTSLLQRNVTIDQIWDHESGITMVPAFVHPRYPMAPPSTQGLTLSDPSFPEYPGESSPHLGDHLVSESREIYSSRGFSPHLRAC